MQKLARVMRACGERWARGWGAASLALAVLVTVPGAAYGQDAKASASALELAEAKRLSSDVGRLYSERKFDAAIPLAQRALAIYDKTLGPEHPAVAASLDNLAVLYYATGDYAQAEPLLRRALAIQEKAVGPEHPLVATFLKHLGDLYFTTGDYAQAEPLLRRALAIDEKALGPEHPAVAASLNHLGELYLTTGDHAQAEPLHRRALAIFAKAFGPEHPEVATSLNNLGSVYQAKGDYAQAEPLLRRALAIWEKALGPEHPAVATSLNNLAMLYKDKGDYAQAEPLLRRALAIREKALGPEHPDVASSLGNLALLYNAKGNYAQAERLFHRALAIREKALGPEHPDVANSLNNLALLYADKGDNTQAELLLRRALTIREKAFGPESPIVAVSFNNLAMLYNANGDYAQAERLLRRAVVILEKALGPEHPDVASSLGNLAGLCRDKGDYTQAERLLRRALAIQEGALGPEHPDVVTTLSHLAVVFEDKGDYAQAEPLLRRALAIAEKALGPEHPEVATSLSNLAVLHLASGELAEALQRRDQATVVEDRNAALVLMTGSDEQKNAYMAKLRGETDSNISLHVQFAPDVQKAKRLALTTILHRKGRVLDAMADSFAALRRRTAPAAQTEFDRLKSLNTEYSALVWRGPGQTPIPEYRAALERLDQQRRALENELTLGNTAIKAEVRPITIEQVQAAIPAGAALVELFRYEPFNPKARNNTDEKWGKARYVAYVLRRDGEITWADLGEAVPIEAAVAAFLPTLQRAAADPKPSARALDALVMQPIRRLLGDTRSVFLSPDGVLNLVPFAALRDEDGHYLVERYAFTYLTSGRDLLRFATRLQSHQRPAIFAAPDFGPEAEYEPTATRAANNTNQRSADMKTRYYGSLAGAADEGQALSKQLPDAQLRTGADATESAVKALLGPRILHIATHGFFLPDQPELRPSIGEMSFGSSEQRGGAHRAIYVENPLLRSGLVFAGANQGKSGTDDGTLTALEAAQINLDGTQLVVLSACETGVGDARNGDGVYGLRRALVIAGAETQVMSLWRVNDETTRTQMAAYYDRLLHGGGRSEAMRQVQLAMLADPAHEPPYYWASFIVSGSPDTLSGKAAPPDFARVTPGARGCACEVAAHSTDQGAAWMLALAGLGLACMRQRRRRCNLASLPAS